MKNRMASFLKRKTDHNETMKKACVLKQLCNTAAWSKGSVTCDKHVVKSFPLNPLFRF